MKVLNADLMSIRYMCYFLPAGKSWKLSVNDFLTVVHEFEKQFDTRGFEKNRVETVDSDLPDEIFGDEKPYITALKADRKIVNSALGEFDSILPSSGYTQSDKLSDDTINDLCQSMRRGWRVESDLPLKSLKVGDDWYNETIVFIDHKKAVVVTDNDGCINYYYVTNPDEKKSNYFGGNYDKYSFLY